MIVEDGKTRRQEGGEGEREKGRKGEREKGRKGEREAFSPSGAACASVISEELFNAMTQRCKDTGLKAESNRR